MKTMLTLRPGWKTLRFLAAICPIVLSACSEYQPKDNVQAHNTLSPTEVVTAHLRVVEQGDWTKADSYLSDNYTMKMKGMPFFVSIKRVDALTMHKARKRAFPDFRFNEKIEWARDNQVKVSVYLTGTHTGVLEYPESVGVPRTEPTGLTIDLPSEHFTYSVENDKIVHTYGEIPEGHGPPALMKQLKIRQE
jgi:predicted ester cyclase